MIGFIR